MRVIVIADTHVPDFAPSLPSELTTALGGADVIVHAGDVTSAAVLDELAAHAPVRVVVGNNDGPDVRRWGARDEIRGELAGVPFAVLHDAGPRAGRVRRLRQRFPLARLVVFGHSHIPMAFEDDGVTFVNPGSPTWKRMQPSPTYALLTIVHGRVRARIVVLRSGTRESSRRA